MKLTSKDLFRNGDIAYLPIGEGVVLQEVEQRILSWALYYGHEVRFSCGVWVDPTTATAERVLRVYRVSTDPTIGEGRRTKVREYRQKWKAEQERIQRERQERRDNREKRLADILARRERGETLGQIANAYGVSRQAIHGYINNKRKEKKNVCNW